MTRVIYDQWGGMIVRMGGFKFFNVFTWLSPLIPCLLLLFFGCTLVNTYRIYAGPIRLPVDMVRAVVKTVDQLFRSSFAPILAARVMLSWIVLRMLYLDQVSLENGLHYDPVLNQVDDRSIRPWFLRTQVYAESFLNRLFEPSAVKVTRYWCRNSTYWQGHSRMNPRSYSCSGSFTDLLRMDPCAISSLLNRVSSRLRVLVSAEQFEIRLFDRGSVVRYPRRWLESNVYSVASVRHDLHPRLMYVSEPIQFVKIISEKRARMQEDQAVLTGEKRARMQAQNLLTYVGKQNERTFNTLLSQFKALIPSSSKLTIVRDEQTLNRVINSINLPRAPTVPSSLYDGYSITRHLSQSLNGSTGLESHHTIIRLDLSVIKRFQVTDLIHVQEIQDVKINVTCIHVQGVMDGSVLTHINSESVRTHIDSRGETAYVRDVIKILNAPRTGSCTYVIKDGWIIELIQKISRLLDYTTKSTIHKKLIMLEFLAHYDLSYNLLPSYRDKEWLSMYIEDKLSFQL